MGKGYAEGPAAEERYEALERGEGFGARAAPADRAAVYGSTPDRPEKHFIGWLGEVDPDEGCSARRTTEMPQAAPEAKSWFGSVSLSQPMKCFSGRSAVEP